MGAQTAILLAICVGSLASAQLPVNNPRGNSAAARPARHSVSGTVVNASTGEPLSKAMVKLDTPDGQFAAFTDQSGHFSVENVPDGQYPLQYQKPGFFLAPSPAGQIAFTQITVSSAAEPITLKLIPAAAITGRVVDEEGQPVENLTIQASFSQFVEGEREWTTLRATTTDEDGNYTLDNLMPGAYRLHLYTHPASPFSDALSGNAQATLPSEVYPPQTYPQSSGTASFEAINLSGGQTEQADFRIKAVPAFRIHGAISPIIPGTFLRVEDADGSDIGVRAGVDPKTGRWMIPALPIGSWRIIAECTNQSGQFWGEANVSVNANMDVRLELQPAATIPVEISPAPDANTFNAQLTLIGESTNAGRSRFQAVSAPDKPTSRTFVNVPPGHYRLWVQHFSVQASEGFCLNSVQFRNTDVGSDGLSIAGGGVLAPMQVGLRNDCGTVQAKLSQPDTLKPVQAVLLSENPIVGPLVIGRNRAEGFTFANLAPGTYKLYAFDSLDGLEYANPDAMKSFPGNEVTVGPQQTISVTVDVIARTTA